MGKVATTAIATVEMTKQQQKMKMKKKKGRPSTKNPSLLSSTNRRSTRRNPNHLNFNDEDEDEDERKEKKVKLVVRLPESSSADDKSNIIINNNNLHNHSGDSASDSDSHPDPQDPDSYANKRNINAGSAHAYLNQEMKAEKTTDDTPLHGSPLETGPTTPLPDKKLLVFILDRLQKKDTYGVFSEPVDPSELPDYFEIIEQPMDFGTLRKKLDDGAYKNLEELEADVFLICSNAMQYNAPDTVYHRQARSIQDIAKRDFENLRHEGDDGEPQPKVVRRGRPPSSKNQKKPLEKPLEKPFETSPVDRVGTELSSGATLASGEDKATGSNSYNLRKASTLYRFRPTDPFVSSHRSRNGENYSEWVADWNDEFPASILRADMKYGKKHFTMDENRRDTYRQFRPLSSCNNSPVLFNSIGDMKRLVPVGLQEPLAYARSLARYAANLGPVPWKMASKKIESLLPAGVQYGPGWVGENHLAPSQPLSFSTDKQKSSNSTTAGDCSASKLMTPSTSDLNSAVAYGPSEGSKLPVHQNPVHQSYRNGFSGMFGNNNLTTEEAKLVESKMTPGKVSDSHGEGQMWNFGKQTQQRHNNAFLVPPDLNVRVAAGSPTSSSLQIGSPQQPDLALQL